MENQNLPMKQESSHPHRVITSIGYTLLRLPQKVEEAVELRVVVTLVLKDLEEKHG
jgi:hypothetical protein